VLTVHYTPQPDTMTAATDFVGATTRTDPTTSQWPRVGDAFLVAFLALYLGRKSGDREPAELESLGAELGEAAQLLGVFIGVNATRIAADEGDE